MFNCLALPPRSEILSESSISTLLSVLFIASNEQAFLLFPAVLAVVVAAFAIISWPWHVTWRCYHYCVGHIMAWDFSDSSFRPSIVLKATHSKLTSMEFLTGNTLSMKHQLLAAGDETGTLHIFEMPRSLVRPAHKEAALMSAFLDREREVRSFFSLFLKKLHMKSDWHASWNTAGSI